MVSMTLLIILFVAANLFISGCYGGLLGFFGGLALCNGACYAGYLACIGVASGGTAVTGGCLLPVLPAIVTACTAGETACIGSCLTAFTVATGPI